ncbi:MAG: hypothetical protein AAFO57_12010 [Pseudomonadota bacterium]
MDIKSLETKLERIDGRLAQMDAARKRAKPSNRRFMQGGLAAIRRRRRKTLEQLLAMR